MNVTVLIHDSVVKLPPEANGAVVVGGSHGAVYAAYNSAKYGCRAAIHHDAGIGKDEAGIGGLAYADSLGMAMAAVATASARIGDGQDMYRRGLISRANTLAQKCGVRVGMSCREAAELLKTAPWPHAKPPTMGETRHLVEGFVCVDSSSLLTLEDRDGIVATGSHCALNSGHAVEPFRPRLVFFNDAGPGIDEGGIWGFKVLDREGIAGVAVAAASARIGDGRSTLQDGTISHANAPARRLGAVVGGSALALARAVAEKA
ncbi:MAG: hypothetical protein JOY81_10530 [Alphaproteobacteria bacterium]|nr:hypothetical protein [Alphaproteobacteria bacterium]